MAKLLIVYLLSLFTAGCFGHIAVAHKANIVACKRPVYVNAFGNLEKRDCATDAQLAAAEKEASGEF